MSEVAIDPVQLPPSWALTTLGAVVRYGSTAKAEPTEITDGAWVLELEDIEKNSSRLLQKMTFLQRQSKSTKNSFQTGDVLYGKLRPYLNKVLIADEPGYCTTEILPLKAGAYLDNRYLFYWLKHPIFLKYVEAESHGMNMPRLGTDAGKAAPFVLAPRSEQTRIADQLDTLLTRIQSCNDRLNAIPALLKRFRQTVLGAATSGVLTQEWRLAGSSRWKNVQLTEVADSFSYGSAAKSAKDGDVPVLRMGNIQDGRLDWSDLVYTSDPKEIEKYRLAKGDVLFNRTNSPELVGKTAVYQGEQTAIYAGYLIRVRCSVELLPEYLNYCLGSKSGRDYCWSVKSDGVSQSNINAKKLGALPFALPPVDEQAEIVRRVQALFSLADGIETRATTAHAHALRLTPLLLAKAFRGELVSQDPTEQPATVVLEQAAALRKKHNADEPAKVKKRKVVMKKSPTGTLKLAIAGLKKDRFTFDDVRSLVGGDYEDLKDALIALLQDKNSALRQVFDEVSGEMQFLGGGQ